MKIDVNGNAAFASTGGRAFDPKAEAVMFIHGSGQSHLSFILQSRFFANRGYAVLSPDMPAHGLSDGDPLTSIEAQADWHADLMAAAGVEKAHVVGHSQGGLIGLELARRHGDKVRSLSFVATALAIPVNDALIDMAKNKEARAIDMMTDWGHGRQGHMHDNTTPGNTHLYFGRELMAANETGALHADLVACNEYKDGAVAAAGVTCPAHVTLGEKDRMTPMKFGLKLAEAVGCTHPTLVQGAGHMLPSEHPIEVNAAVRKFIEANP
ncbi:MAG: alpha/beta hydrolase [Pseudomonadota bacterium]